MNIIFRAVSVPIRMARKVASTVFGLGKRGIKMGLNAAMKVNSFNADMVANVIGKIKGKIKYILQFDVKIKS